MSNNSNMENNSFLATKADGKEISRILESVAGNHLFTMAYTRRPDAYDSYMRESGEAHVYVHKKDDKIVHTCSVLVRDMYINGKITKTGYICGLKKNPEFKDLYPNSIKFFKCFQKEDVDLFYCCVAKDNNFKNMIEKSRKIISFAKITDLKTFMYNPKQRIKVPDHPYTFRQANEGDIITILSFLNEEGKKKEFFPVIKSLDQFYNLKPEDFYLLSDGDEILAAACLWDVSSYKQYTILKYGSLMKMLRLANPLLQALKFLKLPKENVPMEFPFLSFFISKNDNLTNYKIFLNEINKVVAKKYDYLCLALPDNHFAIDIFKNIKNLNIESAIYEVSFSKDLKKDKSLVSGDVFTENALL